MSDPAPNPADAARARILGGDLRRTVLLLALPVLCEQFLNFCVGFYDTFLSGRISATATSAIGLAGYVGWLVSMLYGLVGAGTTALVSRNWGRGDYGEANRVLNRSIALSVVLGLAVFVLVWTAAPLFAAVLHLTDDAGRVAIRYLRMDSIGLIFTGLSLVGAAALRGRGDMRSPMLILALVSVLNVVVSTALVYGVGPIPALGIDGIVAGTVAARCSGGILMLLALTRGLSGLRLDIKELHVRGDIVRRILRIGGPAAVDGAVVWTGHLVFLVIISRLDTGHAAFAAHIVGVRMEAITYLPAVAWGSAAATLIGQSLGGGQPTRALAAGHIAATQCGVLAAGIMAVFYFGAVTIFNVMHTDPLVRDIGIPAFRALAFFQIPTALLIVYNYALQGAGDTRVPMIYNVVGVMAVRLPVAYLCGISFGGGLLGAWVGMFADMTFRASLAWWRFRSERWAHREV